MRASLGSVTTRAFDHLAMRSGDGDVAGSLGPRVTCVVDGDTYWLEGQKYRAFGYSHGQSHRRASAGGDLDRRLAGEGVMRLMELLNTTDITLEPPRRGPLWGTPAGFPTSFHFFFAPTVEGVADILVREGLARYYPPTAMEFWCP